MALLHFYLEHQLISDETKKIFALRLNEDDYRHARAQRLSRGEHIAVIDAAKDYYECEVEEFNSDQLLVHIALKKSNEGIRPSVMLIQGLAKGEKMDSVIRQGTELGVGAFVPFICERSVVKLDAKKTLTRMNRWRSIAKNAAMQSGQPCIPEISEPLLLEEVCSILSNAAAVLICWEEEKEKGIGESLRTALAKQGIFDEDARVAVVIGPEGGLTQQEVDALLASNVFAESVSLGQSILRTETAGVVAPAIVLYELGALS